MCKLGKVTKLIVCKLDKVTHTHDPHRLIVHTHNTVMCSEARLLVCDCVVHWLPVGGEVVSLPPQCSGPHCTPLPQSQQPANWDLHSRLGQTSCKCTCPEEKSKLHVEAAMTQLMYITYCLPIGAAPPSFYCVSCLHECSIIIVQMIFTLDQSLRLIIKACRSLSIFLEYIAM